MEQAPICITAANRIINRTNAQNAWRYQTGKPRVKYQIKRVQLLLYFAKLVWLCDYQDCEMIPENFMSYAGPRIFALYEYWPTWSEGDMYPRKELETRPLTKEEEDFINALVDTTIDISAETLQDYANLSKGPVKVSEKAGVDVTKETMRCYVKHKDNQEKLIYFLKTGRGVITCPNCLR